MKIIFHLVFLVLLLSCNSTKKVAVDSSGHDEAAILERNANHENARMRYKLVQSRFLDKSKIQKNVLSQIEDFTEEDYSSLKPLIFEQDIPAIQAHIASGKLSYKRLTQWYLYRINKYEFDPNVTLNTIIAVNPDAVSEAMLRDQEKSKEDHPIYGMPILLKDNINTEGMRTTAGAIALAKNETDDAFIVRQLKSKGAIILGKVNLSEWAYFFCAGCPVGYSAVGGQTLNPYGRTIFETGGSSSGSGTSMAANYAAGAIGTETSGSILSPSSKNSVVGLKPTVGLLSRSGIVPISSTLDTPGPMTRTVTDNAIMLSALTGRDATDPYTEISYEMGDLLSELESVSVEGLRIGANKKYMDDEPLYAEIMLMLNRRGAEIFGFEPKEVKLNGFSSILNIDMKNDLPAYIENYGGKAVKVKTVAEVVAFNEKNLELRAPYGQERLEGILVDETTEDELEIIITDARTAARSFFDEPIAEFNLDVITSINNYDAGRAAIAHYPALTIPMGYKENGEPMNLTLIGKSLSERDLLKIGYAIEQITMMRRPPKAMD